MKLVDKVAVVTGAGAGIGEVYAWALAREGAAVVVADLDAAAAGRVVDALAEAGHQALAVVGDIADDATVSTMAEATIERFGGIDILVNNAGLHLLDWNDGTTLSAARWRRILDVNVVAPVACAAACRDSMASRGGGAIVNQSSMAAYRGAGAYGVSKLALNGVTTALATELAPLGIRVNGIAPGLVDSPAAMGLLPEAMQEFVLAGQLVKRIGRMEDLAPMLVYLCSADSSFVTGQTFLVDGGATPRA